MSTKKAFARRNKREHIGQEAPPQTLVGRFTEQVTNMESRTACQVLAHTVIIKSHKEIEVIVNPYMGTTTFKVRDFTRMNPQEFSFLKVE